MVDERLKKIFRDNDICSIYEKCKQAYIQEENLDEDKKTYIDNVFKKLDALFNYAVRFNPNLFAINNQKINNWAEPPIDKATKTEIKRMLKNFGGNKPLVSKITIPISKLIKNLKEDELNKIFGEYEQEFRTYIETNQDNISIETSLEKIKNKEEAAIFTEKLKSLFNSYKNNKEFEGSLVKFNYEDFLKSQSQFVDFLKLEVDDRKDFLDELKDISRYLYFNIPSDEDVNQKSLSQFVTNMIVKFFSERDISDVFSKVKTSGESDSILDLIIKNLEDIDDDELANMKKAHYQFMSVENINGTLLESFLASVLEEDGWIWCSGSIYRAVDFCKITDEKIELLQVKNKYNSENSSSSAVRQKTAIKKWHRLRKDKDNWAELHTLLGDSCQDSLNEEKYKEYVQNKIKEYKKS